MIERLQQFFAANDSLVQFAHGQVFFVLGVAMWLQWRQRSQLELARALPWLAAFGILEAFSVWANVFVPMQARLLSSDAIEVLRFLQLLLTLATFAALLGFGLKLSEPSLPPWSAWYVPLLLWLSVAIVLLIQRVAAGEPGVVRNATNEAFLRYSICTPAALLAAFGLRQQAGRLVGPLNIERIVRALRVAGIGFVLYALLEGVLVPVAPFFPANVFNEMALYRTTGVPAGVPRTIAGAVIAWSFLRALEVFRVEVERVAQALQREQSLNAERERISRELHDGTIQSIYAAGLALDDAHHSLQSLCTPPDQLAPEDAAAIANARSQVRLVMDALNRTVQDIRRYIYDLRSAGAEEDLARGLVQIVNEWRMRSRLPIEWSVEGHPLRQLTTEQRQHIYQIVREALSNIVRHSGATRARVELRYGQCGDGQADLCLQISDNGNGRALISERQGYGLRNMRERARLLGARLTIESTPGVGTVVTLQVGN
ncbi:MAG: sensor histidine kinase [Anaerolineae bacterium]|nr:sensor histidine kinase [Thermoflexales bacterium]MDW8406157.1 sensor histidine kinase [Anaerolineae bacterium]